MEWLYYQLGYWLYYGLLFIVGYFLLRRLILENFYISIRNRYVLITGCDSGFGRLLALRLISQGVHVFAGCYTQTGGESLQKQCLDEKAKGHGDLHVVKIDITNEESVILAKAQVEKVLKETGGQLHGVVNNAGIFTTFGPDDWCTTAEFQLSLNVNTLGAVRVCHAFLPLVKASQGRIVTMGSTAGRLHGKFVAPYATAKFAVEAYMDCLRLELRPFGVSVHVLEPGCFKTELLNEDAQHARINRIWNQLPMAVKEEYGDRYLHNFKIAWQNGVNIVANPNLQWVVSCYEHALFGAWPRLRYAAGWDAIFCFIPLSCLPTFVQDTALDILYGLQSGPPLKPAALENKQSRLGKAWNWMSALGSQLGLLSFGLALFSVKATALFGQADAAVTANATNKEE